MKYIEDVNYDDGVEADDDDADDDADDGVDADNDEKDENDHFNTTR